MEPNHPAQTIFGPIAQTGKTDIDLSILIPCLNEEKNVVGAITNASAAAESLGYPYELIVIDDGSTDKTNEVVRDFMKANPQIPIVLKTNKKNRGLARGFVDGAFVARGKYFRLCCGDNVEPKETLVKIFGQMGKADIAVPYQPTAPRTPLRLVLSNMYVRLVNLSSGHKLRYYNGCPLFKTEQVRRWHSYSYGFGFQADMITRMLDDGATFIEFPVEVTDRQFGSSKALTFRNLASTGHTLLEILFRRLRNWIFDE
jgi:glycosyltransferase involved in cell wall biosynthesis